MLVDYFSGETYLHFVFCTSCETGSGSAPAPLIAGRSPSLPPWAVFGRICCLIHPDKPQVSHAFRSSRAFSYFTSSSGFGRAAVRRSLAIFGVLGSLNVCCKRTL